MISLIAVVFLAVFAEYWLNRKTKLPKLPDFMERPVEKITVPTQEQLAGSFEAYQKGRKEGLLQRIENQQKSKEMTEQVPSVQPTETISDEEPPIYQKLRELSRAPRTGGSKFVDIDPSDLGPVSFVSLPKLPDEPPEE